MSVPTPTELVTWLREQIAEAEQTAREATPGPWAKNEAPDSRWYLHPWPKADNLGEVARREDADHIELNDPRAVLAQCDAHWQIVDDCVDILAVDSWEYTDALDLAERTLRRIALAYQHRPGYREQWRPE